MATLKFKNVNKIYPNRVQAVFDFNLDVKNNEFIVLVGPSGCGKSTTLRMLAGFEDISTGEIYIDGVKVNKMAPKDRNIAMVFQNYALYPHMTVYDNMAFALKLRKVSKPLFEVDEKNPKYIKEVEEATNKSNEELKEGLDKLKLDRATKNAIKEFKFAKANELKVKLIKIDEKYSKPVYTYDHKKANELEDAINAEVNKVKIAVNTINKEIKKENDKPKVFRDEVALSISREKSEFKLNAKDLNRRIKKERHPNEVEKLKKELAQLSEAHDKKIKELETTLADAKEFTVDQKRIDELNKELEKAKTLVVDQKKVDNLKAELEKVYAKETFQAYSTQHYTSDEIAEKVTEAAEILGLTPYLKRKPAALSGGQRQRVALGRAIVRKPKVFLMDEPLSNLDAKLRVQTRGEIAKIHQRVGATTIYVTHDQTEAMTMADRIVVMKDGYVQQVGTPKEVYAHPSNIFVAGFIGSPSMNFFSGSFDGKNFKFANSDVKFELTKELIASLKSYKGKEVVMGIRPEDIYFDTDKSLTHKSKPVKVKAELSELLGHEIIVYGNVANQKIIIKTVANKEVAAGDTYAYSYDVTKVHFFDPKTTKCICSATKK